jgi:hypothetical protein
MRYFIFILSLLAGTVIYMPAVQAATPDWSAYDRILAQHLAEVGGNIRFTGINYPALRADRDFSEAVRVIADYPLSQLKTPEERLSFYINAYNILAIKTVLDHWPLNSIKDAGSWLKPVWDKPAGRIGGRSVSLDEIEHRILRPMGEPRIHFAIVCASISCPDLRREAYRAEKLEQQLDDQVRKFLSNPGKGLRIENGTIRISQIFDWFEDDFAKAGGVAAFLERYASIPPKHRITADLPYNWKLNSQSEPPP